MANLATFKDIQDRVITYGYSEQHRTQIKAWINDAYRDLCRWRRWSWLIFTDNVVTVAGTRTVALPSTAARRFVAILEVKPNDAAVDGNALTYEDIDHDDPFGFERQNLARRTVRGIPTRYSVDGTNLVLDPIPDRVITYSVRHYDMPVTELSADADPLLTPADANQALVYAALALAAGHDRNPGLAQLWYDKHLTTVRQLEVQETTRNVQRTPRARLPAVYGRRFGV